MATSNVSVKVIAWEGFPSVERAAALKDELAEALDHNVQVVLSVSLLEGMDLSILQLLKSARLEAVKRNKSFRLAGTIRTELGRILVLSGFVKKAPENARDMEGEFFGTSDPLREKPE
jgi:hypothetical protein